MKTLKLSIILQFFFVYFSIGQNIELKGRITDSKTQQALEGASIFVQGRQLGTVSDENGEFTLHSVKPIQKITASFIGYRTENLEVKGQFIEIKLIKTSLDLDEVIVTGTTIGKSKNEMNYSINTISQQMIEQSSEASAILPIISQQTPGIFVTERSVTGFGVSTGAAGKISVRGVSSSPDPYGNANTEVLIIVDGNPNIMGLFGHPLSDAYVASDIEKVEIIRGAASTLYGSGAMGGVVNIITKDQKKDGFTANSRISYGSFNTQKYMLNSGYKQGKFSVFAAINHDHSNGHRGGKDSAAFDITNGFLKFNYTINDHFKLSWDGSIAKFKANDPGAFSKPVLFSVDILRGRTSLILSNKYNKAEGSLNVFYNFGEHDLSDGWHSNDEVKGFIFTEGFSLIKNNVVTVGAELRNSGGQGNSGMNANKWLSVNETGVFVLVQQKLFKMLSLDAGLRLVNNSIFGNRLIPHAGANFNFLTSSSVRINISKGYRSPTLMELYLFAPNNSLLPEEMMNYEAGYSKSFLKNKFGIDLTIFYSNGKNLILKTTPPPFPPSRVNSGSFEHKGIELMLNYKPNEKLSFSCNYSYLNMKTPLVGAPTHHFQLMSGYKTGKFHFFANVEQVSGLYTSVKSDPSFWGSGTSEKIENYTLLNAKISWLPSKYFDAFISGENLLNQKYETMYDYPMPGITVIGGINLHFKSK